MSAQDPDVIGAMVRVELRTPSAPDVYLLRSGAVDVTFYASPFLKYDLSFRDGRVAALAWAEELVAKLRKFGPSGAGLT